MSVPYPDPIRSIEWLMAESLDANDYNPNVVFNQELRLLERSILRTGWVQPILISKDRIVIDGFHRRMLGMQSKALLERYGGLVPCAVLNVDRAEAMLLTIRMNRAKGSHVAVRMATIVIELVDKHQVPMENIAEEIGAHLDEVKILYENSVFKNRNLNNYAYSKAWVPDSK